ncbi:MAG: iron ABC transporter permease [Actinomycetaceae bacterium]|nr:iron ABC transporter permease [Actinomycetaceae bacterium]
MTHTVTRGGDDAHGVIAAYRQTIFRRVLILFVIVAATAALILWAATLGPLNIGLRELWQAIFYPDTVPGVVRAAVWQIRLPSLLLATLIGVALGIAGLQMQTILDNPLAEPFTLGLSGAAAFGAAAAIVLDWTIPGYEESSITIFAWAWSMIATVVIVVMARARGAGSQTMVLMGIAVVFGFSAAVSLLQYAATTEALSQIVFWTMGSLTRATWNHVLILGIVVIVSLPWWLLHQWDLTVMRMGENRAKALGVNTGRIRIISLIFISLLAATAVAFAGVIGFIGMIAPHVSRVLVGENQRLLLPMTIVVGAFVMTASHVISISIISGVAIPVGIVTAIIGVPLFVTIVLSKQTVQWGGQ